MKIFKYNDEIFKECGYVQMQFKKKGEREYFLTLPGGRNGFPRFHIKETEEGNFDLHYDKKRMHGKFMGWLFNIHFRKHNHDDIIFKEKLRLEIVHQVHVLKEMMDNSNAKYCQIDELKRKYSRL